MRDEWQHERGVGSLEVMGVVTVVVLLVAGVLAGLSSYPGHMASALCKVAAAIGSASECDAPPLAEPDPTDEDYLPPSCMAHETSEQYSATVKVWFFEFGQDSGFVVQEFADGTVRVTVTDGVGLGAGGSVTSNTFDIGKVGGGGNSGLDVDLGGGVKFSYGDTWTFDSPEQWGEMKDQLDDYLLQQEMLKHEGGFWGAKAMGWKDPPKDPEVSFTQAELELTLDAAFGLKDPTGTLDDQGNPEFFDPNVGVTLSASAGAAVMIETNHENGETSWTYSVSGEGAVGADVVVGHGEAAGKIDGAFTVTRDKDGQVTEVVFQSVREGGVSGGLGNDSFDQASGGGSHSESESLVTTTRLTVDDGNRDLVDSWLADRNDAGVALSLPFAAMVPDRPSDDPFLDLLYRDATTSQITYLNVRDKWEFEAAVKKGWQFGFGISGENATADAVNADYLGAPRQDGIRTMIPDGTCT
ncbi:hypothetical protein CBZ_31070 [Cellulomonas biazotea]|uniref:Uncharacterized protein n=1 Tax=Cellulomonas biazotea TaxID=1709 RepID=A0A402DV88_9CELL|nr:hypothetical protein CBZ_31070 [Cellulomonas biazotea]